jgi:hypothetical protein
LPTYPVKRLVVKSEQKGDDGHDGNRKQLLTFSFPNLNGSHSPSPQFVNPTCITGELERQSARLCRARMFYYAPWLKQTGRSIGNGA